MKKQAVPTLGVLQYFLDATVQVSTDIEQQQVTDDDNVIYAKLAYQGVLLDFDDTWVVLGYYDDEGAPTIVAAIKLENVVAIDLNHNNLQDTAEQPPKGEVN